MTDTTSPIIRVEKLGKRFGEREILADISFELDRGKALALVGPSGGGKTTLLRCLNGLEVADEGNLHVGGTSMEGKPGAGARLALDQLRKKVGFVFQQWHLFQHRTALGNVIEAPIVVKKEARAQAIERGRALLAKVGAAHRENAYPHEMSGGEQQRVAIARALAMEPEVLLMDEPTSALDPERIADLARLLESLLREGLTLVAVTHDMDFAKRIAHEVIVLHSGAIIERGSPRKVFEEPTDQRTRAFLGMVET